VTDACPSCGVPYVDHLGLIGTCADLLAARRELLRLQAGPVVVLAADLADAYVVAVRVLESRCGGASDGDQVAREQLALEAIRNASFKKNENSI
jgi:hypothetical protein